MFDKYIKIPNIMIEDRNLKTIDLIIFGYIYSICYSNEFFNGSNGYLADLLNVSKCTISRAIERLKREKYLYIEYKKTESNYMKRRIYIYDGYNQKC